MAWLRRWILALAAWPGTDFRGAALGSPTPDDDKGLHCDGPRRAQPAERGADFRRARMRFARLVHPADLTRADFRGARDLHLADVRGTILDDRRVRELLVSGQGRGRCYEHADLRGAWLEGADLRDADLRDAQLSGACLRGADLTGADLSRATAVGADFTGARMTGACLEAWNIEPDTCLDGVQADYVWLLSDRRERRPASGAFLPGQFTKLFEEVLDTVDFVFDKGIDWRAFVVTLDKLKVAAGDSGDEIAVQGIENKGDGVFVVRISVPSGMDKGAVHRDFSADYERQILLKDERIRQLEADRDRTARQAKKTDRDRQAEIARLDRQNTDLTEIVCALSRARCEPGQDIFIDRVGQIDMGKNSVSVGSVTGSNLNIQSALERVGQSVGTLPGADESARVRLAELLGRLDAALKQVPQERAQEAAAVLGLD